MIRALSRSLLLTALLAAGLAEAGPAATEACPDAPLAVKQEVRLAVFGWALVHYSELVQDVRVARVCGDWALAILVPRANVDGAAVILRRGADTWHVVAGPGTAFSPETRPAGAPPELFGEERDRSPP